MSKRAALAVVVLSVIGGAMVAAADLSRSYIPLFFTWGAFGAIPWVLGRIEGDRQS